ncbi:MAG: A/G-specific adenine glycosylase [Planctomycetota bacterium]
MTRRTSKVPASDSASDPTPPHDPCWRKSDWRSRVRKRLLEWFAGNARVLPWRTLPLPYNVWVSEIMLQQTQVATVLPYFHRWMEAFPTVEALASADEADLMRHWEGLGYYRRVRSMHAAAKKIMEDHGGVFPTRFEDVLALPGIGRYTAGAILSISQDQRLPILEGNTQRVFSRWIAMRGAPAEKHANALLWDFAETMLPRDGGNGTFNQAAMELGALVCTPKQPRCDECPIAGSCRAAKLGLQQEIPGKIKSIRYEDRTEFALVVPSPGGDTFLVRPLPDGARWSGLWDYPRPTEDAYQSVETVADWLSKELHLAPGCEIEVGARLKSIRHAVTKYRITLHVHAAILKTSGEPAELPAPWQWQSLDQLTEQPLSVTGRKITNWLAAQEQPLLW